MGYMFEAEIDAIMHAVRARTIGEEDSITLRKVLAARIHPAIAAYFRAEVEKKLRDERAHEFRSKRFPYAHPEVVSLQRQIDVLLVQHYTFDRSEFETLLDQSVHFEFNYLCRPQWTLLNFIMGDQRRTPVTAVERKLQYCIDYRYFAEFIKRTIDERGQTEITYEEFKALLEKIDRAVIAEHTSAELARMLRALSAFVDLGHPEAPNGNAHLPINAAIVFFEDKRMQELTARLEEERDRNGRATITLDELGRTIQEVRAASAMESPLPEPAAPEIMPEAPLVPAVSANGPAALAPAPTMPAEPPPSTLATEKAVPEGSSVGDLISVSDLFSAAEQKKFIRQLFGKDDWAFQTAVEELDQLQTWQETSHFLDNLFTVHQVDPFSEPAVEFTDRLYTRFFPHATDEA